MTWVVGVTGFPSGGYLFSDIRVSLEVRVQRTFAPFGVQKVHPVAPFVAAGFAGSIEVGFWSLEALRLFLKIGRPNDVAVLPCRSIYLFSRRLRGAWQRRVPDQLKAAGLQLLIVGASPESRPGMTVSHGFVLAAPAFEPRKLRAWEADGIGSGAEIRILREEADRVRADIADLVGFEAGGLFDALGGVGIPIAQALADAIARSGESTVSEHLHITRVRLGDIGMIANATEFVAPVDAPGLAPDHGPPSRTMPSEVARTWPEFRKYAQGARISIAEARA